jgi:CubicO group peptidase (beta-lactamase class C family)
MRASIAVAIALIGVVARGVAQAAPAAPVSSSGDVAGRARDFVSTLNASDPAAVNRFRDNDLSDDFAKNIPADAMLFWFRSHRRVSGGEDLIAVRRKAGSPNVFEAVVRDRVYRQLHGFVLTLDGAADQRLSYFEPADATPAWAIKRRTSLTPSQVASRSRDMMRRGCQAGVFSGAVLVARGERVIFQGACGQASLRYHAMNNVGTRFNLGSMNKMFTAVAVMQMVESGKVSLSDPLSKYADATWLPREISSRITVGELMTHTSGLGDFFDDGFDNTSRALYRELDDYKPLIRTEKLAFPPGAKYQYSNTGMFMLGVVVEKASGENYFDYIRRHIYAPAGMTATDCYPMNEPVENLATGYGYYFKGPYHWRENTFDHVFRGGPAGGGFSTVGDLFRFARALQGGKLVSAASLKFLWTDRPPNNYGAGFEVSSTAAGKAVGHSGVFEGISSRLSLFLDKGYVVAVLSNIDDAAPPLMDAIGDQIALAR